MQIYKNTTIINGKKEGSSITFVHVPKCRVLAVNYSIYMPNCIILAVKCGVNSSRCTVLEVECSI